jgi:hypothetical protein
MTYTPNANAHRLANRWGGLFMAISATAMIAIIVLFLTSGAVAPPGSSLQETADALANAGIALEFSAYLSIPVDLLMLVGAILLASRPVVDAATHWARVAWTTIAAAVVLIIQFDLILPNAIIPLAKAYGQEPALFNAVYTTSNFIHSVGLLVTYLAFILVLALEIRSTQPAISKKIAHAGVALWILGCVVAIGLIVEYPMIAVAPNILLGWAVVAYYGWRVSRTGRPAGVSSRAHPTGA